MRRKSKKYNEMTEALKDKPQPMPLDEALAILKGFPPAKFDQSIECVLNLGIDPKQADQMVRGSISLPKGIGKTFRVVAFCEGDAVEQALAAGAIEAGSDELLKKIQGGWLDFDVALATPAMMRLVGRLGKVLGPQGKMPSPKAGTVTENIVDAVKDYSAGKQEYRNDAGGNIHLVVGKLSFEADALKENIEAFVKQIKKVKPVAAKGTYMKKCVVSATMSPGIAVQVG